VKYLIQIHAANYQPELIQ